LVAEVVNEPAFPSEALESMKADQLRRMDNRQTQPASRALSREDALLFGIQTSGDVVRAATADSVRQYWSASYRPAAAHLYVAGVFDNEAVDRAVRESFASESSKPVIHLIDRPGATQSHIAVAWPMPDPAHADYFVLNVMNIVMGSMQRSRIIANVREQHGYSYNIFSRLYGRPRSSKWGVSGDVATASTAAALREILAEVARLGEEPPSPGELRRFQTFMSGVLLSERATPEGIVSALRWQELHGLPADDWATFVPRVYAVTPEDLRRVARRYLAPSRAAIVVIGDRKAIEAKLGEVGRVVNE